MDWKDTAVQLANTLIGLSILVSHGGDSPEMRALINAGCRSAWMMGDSVLVKLTPEERHALMAKSLQQQGETLIKNFKTVLDG